MPQHDSCRGGNASPWTPIRCCLFAVLRALEVMGEAAGKVSDELRPMAPDIPWGAIAGMRNRLVHGYFDVDKNVVWNTVVGELPALVKQLRTFLNPAD